MQAKQFHISHEPILFSVVIFFSLYKTKILYFQEVISLVLCGVLCQIGTCLTVC